eukprot:gene3509-4009_t
MFIDWAVTLNLLDNDKSILKDFPLSVKRTLVIQIVQQFLLDPSTNNPAIVSTREHLSWLMEVIEQGFLLPLDDAASIFACVELYKRWLFDSRMRPQPLTDDHGEVFIRRILEQLTLVLQPRPLATREAAETHIILCQKVLQLNLDIARALSRNFSTATFEHWVTLLLAATDCALNTATRTDELLARSICPLLLKVLIEIWLTSRTRSPVLWAAFQKYAGGWLHHMPAIHTWSLTCGAVTTLLVSHLYGDVPLPNTVSLALEDGVSVEIERDYLVFAWHRLLHLVGNPNTIKSPTIFAAAMGGVVQLVNAFVAARADGTAVLHLFGSWLFEAVKTVRPGFDEGVALATEVLAHLFLSLAPHAPFLPVHLGALYSSLAEVLWSDGRVLFAGVIHTQHLLASELPGVRILVPSYIRALGRILTIIPGSSSEALRRAAIRILGALMCTARRFESVAFHHFFNKRPMEYYPPLPTDITGRLELAQPDLNTFRDVAPHVAHLILSSLNTETSPSNLQTLLWYVLAFHLEHHTMTPPPVAPGFPTPPPAAPFLGCAINIVLKKATAFAGAWPADVVITALGLLGSLAEHHRTITAPSFGELAHTVVRKLCKYTVFKCRESPMSSDTAALIVAALQTISEWSIVSGWLFEGNHRTDTSTLYMLFDALTVALGGKSPNEEISSNSSISSSTQAASNADLDRASNQVPLPADVRNMAQCVLQTVLTRMSHFPNPDNAVSSQTSSCWLEADIIERIRQRATEAGHPSFPVEQCIRFFSINNASTLLTLIDQPFGERGPYVTVIVRDATGRYVVDADLSFQPFRPRPSDDPSDVISDSEGASNYSTMPPRPPHSTLSPFAPNHADCRENLTDILNYIGRHPDDSFTRSVATHADATLRALAATSYGLLHSVGIQPPTLPSIARYAGACKFQHARILLSNLGLSALDSKGKVCAIENTPTFYQALSSLDAIPERSQTRIAVLYARAADRTEDDALAHAAHDTSSDYHDFIASLGWAIDVATHTGFLGGLDRRETHGRTAPYYATATRETIFHVATLMPSQDRSVEHKRRLLSKASVVVVWFDGTPEAYEALPLDSFRDTIHLVVFPLSSGLFRVKTYKNQYKKVTFGPINDDVVASKQILPVLAKTTAINACTQLLIEEGRHVHQFMHRRKMVKDVSDSFRREMSVQQNYLNLFTPLKEDQYFRAPAETYYTEPEAFKPATKPSPRLRPVSVQIAPLPKSTSLSTSTVAAAPVAAPPPSPARGYVSRPLSVPHSVAPLSSSTSSSSTSSSTSSTPSPQPRINTTQFGMSRTTNLQSSQQQQQPQPQPTVPKPAKNWGSLRPTTAGKPEATTPTPTATAPASQQSPSQPARGNFFTRRPMGGSNEEKE